MTERLDSRAWTLGVNAASSETSPLPGSEAARGRPDTAERVWAVVLAGGWGTRLQQFIRHITGSERPKQFCRIIGTRSMLRHTWDRTRQIVPSDRMVTVLTAGQERFLTAEEAAGGVPGSVLVQPANKETAPGLLLPLLWITERDPSATVVVFPADHFIWEEATFLAQVRAAVVASQRFRDRLVVLSVEADAPEQSYGWIAPGPLCGAGEGVALYRVQEFWEKPDRQTAARLFGSGCLWNTFVLVGHPTAFVRAARNTVPELLESLTVAAAFLGTRYEADILAATYQKLRATDFSRALLASRPEALLTLPVRGVYWSDWGNPDRIVQTLRRFDRRPRWLPAYAQTRVQGAQAH